MTKSQLVVALQQAFLAGVRAQGGSGADDSDAIKARAQKWAEVRAGKAVSHAV